MKLFFSTSGKAGRSGGAASVGGSPAVRRPRRGFMLITVILIIAFVTLLLISFSVLIRLETLSSSNGKLLHQARQNSLVGLQSALGELQKHAGPDQRVTAAASILDANAGTPEIDGIAQPYWTGVWNPTRYNVSGKNSPWDPAAGTAPSYYADSPGKRLGFGRWMVSLKDDATAESIDAVKSFDPAAADSVLMVGAGTLVKPGAAASLAPALSKAYASKLEFDGAVPALKNHYAWWVGDEGVKARINRVDANRLTGATPSTGTQLSALAAAPRAALELLQGFADIDSTSAQGQENIIKVANRGSMPLGFKSSGSTVYTSEQFGGKFHDLTLFSEGVMSDTKNGGLRQDLNALCELPSLPSVFTGSDMTKAKVWTKNGSQGPLWSILYNHYRRYKAVVKDPVSGDLTYDMSAPDSKYKGGNQYNFFSDQDKDFPMPVISKIQYVFSVFVAAPRWGMNPNDGVNNESESGTYGQTTGALVTPARPYTLRMVAFPVITVWNPYNVALKSRQIALRLYKPPVEVNIFTSGRGWLGWQSVNDLFPGGSRAPGIDPSVENPNASQWVSEPLNNALINFDHFMTWQGQNIPGSTAGVTDSGILGPGETKVLGKRRRASRSTENVVVPEARRFPALGTIPMLPGWNRGGGSYSPALSPGVHSIPANPWRVVFVNDADSIQFNVRPYQHNNLLRGLTFLADVMPTTNDGSDVIGESFGEISLRSDSTTTLNKLMSTSLGKPASDLTASDFPSYTGASIRSTLANTSGGMGSRMPVFAVNVTLRDLANAKTKFNLFTDMNGIFSRLESGSADAVDLAQYDISIQPFTAGWNGTVEIDSADNSGYVGTGSTFADGQKRFTAKEIPTQPIVSLGQLQHASLGRDYNQPMYQNAPWAGAPLRNSPTAMTSRGAGANYALGNSFSHPLIPPEKTFDNDAVDPFFYTNESLWDGFFFSSLSPWPAPAFLAKGQPATSMGDMFYKSGASPSGFATGTSLPNPNMRFYLPDGKTVAEAKSDLFDGAGNVKADAYKKVAAYLLVDGSFNINSTSVDAWATMLAGRRNAKIPVYSAKTVSTKTSTLTPIARYFPPNAGAPTNNNDFKDASFWQGYRELTDAQIRELAENIVAQVKLRGPFMSLGEFANRQISNNSTLNAVGAVQAALDKSSLNSVFAAPAITNGAAFKNPEAAKGAVAAGAPGYVTQADVLTPLAPSLSARSDTFTIRAYGDVTRSGKVLARAWCEAVVQRLPEYVDPANTPEISQADPALSAINQKFGRKFRVVSFRWLNEEDI